jgi:hypothetical protein
MTGELVDQYGWLWARNSTNISHLQVKKEHIGVYVLCDGSMPVYIGKGNIFRRIRRHNRSPGKEKYWDHFSWFALAKPEFVNDLEALLIRMLPFYLRSLNKQRPRFKRAPKQMQELKKHVEPPREFPNFAPKKRKK